MKRNNGLLHELLAVESDLRTAKERTRDEVVRDFTTAPTAFLGAIKNLKMFDESRQGEEQEVRVEVSNTVTEKLSEVTAAFTRYWDLRLQKEAANQAACADVVIDGKTIFTDVPVTFLLNMEEELRQVKKVYSVMPTLKPGITWDVDVNKGRGIYKSTHNTETAKTEKTKQYKVIVQATDKFPAQVETWNDDRPIGKYITQNWSGMSSEADKALLISRIDLILAAFKKARQRGNCTETKPRQIGKAVFDIIHAGTE
jgi:hypothetical protein